MRSTKLISCMIATVLLSMLFLGCGNTVAAPKQDATAIPQQDVTANPQQDEVTISQQDIVSIPSSEVALADTPTSVMEVHFIDVGHGDATLVKCDGQAMLIDAGDNSRGTAIQLYLNKQGVDKLDYLILTHPDKDHIGGADVIVTKFNISNVFMSQYVKDSKTYEELLQALQYKSLNWSTPTVGSTYTLGSAEFTILAPNKIYTDSNNSSIAFLLKNGDNKFLFTGDCEEKAEGDILANGISINADVYDVGHHGSRTSSSKAFLDAVTPTYAVISCLEGNEYGHPHAEPLNDFRAMGVKVFRTDEQGSIIATSDGKSITWNCAPSETWQTGDGAPVVASANEAAPAVATTDETALVIAPAPEPEQ